MDLIDSKYIGLVSSRLQKFKRVKADLYNFRCCLCGDSQKNKSKTRGYLYAVKTNTNFKCHNCGVNISFNNFLKQIDSVIYKQYTFEKFKDGKTGRNSSTSDAIIKLQTLLGDRDDIKIVGDRFIFESELLFDSASANLQEKGKEKHCLALHTRRVTWV